jgi:hypothetical protein
MPVLELLGAAVLGIVVIGGSIVLGLRLSRSEMTALRERVAAVNATLAELARRLDLECRVPASYRHPVVGEVPGFATVAGERKGWSLQVAYESDEDSGNFVVSLAPRDEQRWPDLGWVRLPADADGFPALAPALAMLGDEVAKLRVQPRVLRAIVRSGSASAQELHAIVDALLVLARTLASMP